MTALAATPAAAAELPEWRLDDLYAGLDDPRIERDLQAAAKSTKALAAMEGGLLAARADAAGLGRLLAGGIALYEEAVNRLWSVSAYASLQTSTRREDPAWA
jgi:oligoendopeptidase F